MHIWSYGLAEFLRHSNEDAICSAFIGDLISRGARRIWPDCTNFIRVADIGCGPGSKAVKVAQFLRREGLKTHWDLIDIDTRWKDTLTENLRHTGNMNDVRFDVHCPLSAGSWAKSSRTAPHVAQFIQVPYDDETEEMVYTLTLELAAKRSFILVSAEHPQSDLNLIRKKFAALGYRGLPSGRVTSLARRFKDRGLLVKSYILRKQYLDIGFADQDANTEWLWDLIFGSKHSKQDERKLAEVIEQFCANAFVPSLNSAILSVPDLLITVRQRA
jgi:hypothetical protein